MEPTYETNPAAAELPMPVGGTPNSAEQAGDQRAAPAEGQMSSGASAPSAAAVPDPQLTASGVQGAIPVTPASPSSQAGDDASMIADDADLIEKEWVIRAKSIVSQTQTDPFIQNKEINKMKSEYIKKRYNKDVKVSEGP